jgi:hypothetical protein
MPARVWRAFVGVLASMVAASGPAAADDAIYPPVNYPPVMNPCGECHMVFPAEMLPKASWIAILAKLDDHFGEDATIPDDQVKAIRAYLTQHAADSPNATPQDRHYMAAIPLGGAPLRITQTPWWNQMHADFDFEGVKRSDVKSPANCPACHKNAVD